MAIQRELMEGEIHKAAMARADLHDELGRTGPTFIKDPEIRDGDGGRAEFAFGKLCGIMPDTAERPSGDKGVDFWVPVWFKVDVKGSRNPGHLIVTPGTVNSHIYVLYDTHPDWPEACPLGWATRSDVENAPLKDFKAGGPPAHAIRQGELREFPILAEMVRRHKDGRVI